MLDEKSISIKDLPAAYACTHSLLHKLNDLQKTTIDSKQAAQFVQLLETTLPTESDAQVETCLIRDLDSSAPDYESCLKHSNLLARAYSYMDSLRTSDILKALFILPLEVRRNQADSQLLQ